MALYETLFIVRPEHGAKVKELADKFKGIIEGIGAAEIRVEEWGIRDLAYPIQKQRRGYYNLMQYRAAAGAVDELERNLRLSEEVMRSLTVCLDEEGMAAPPPGAKDRPEEAKGGAEANASEGESQS